MGGKKCAGDIIVNDFSLETPSGGQPLIHEATLRLVQVPTL